MTNSEFQDQLQEWYQKHPIINLSKIKTFNEFEYVLRQESADDFCISFWGDEQGFLMGSLSETFITTRLRGMKVVSVDYREEVIEGQLCKSLSVEVKK